MKISHIGIWTNDIDGMKNFYMHYFDASFKESFSNHTRDFRSYLITFEGECNIILMQMPGVNQSKNEIKKQYIGYNHIIIDVGSKQKVDLLTEELRADGFRVISEPRTMSDNYYLSVILDPEGNRVTLKA